MILVEIIILKLKICNNNKNYNFNTNAYFNNKSKNVIIRGRAVLKSQTYMVTKILLRKKRYTTTPPDFVVF